MNWRDISILQELQTAVSGSIGGRVRQFWAWWWGEIRALLPGKLSRAIDAASEQDFLLVNGDVLVVRRGHFNQSREVARQPLSASEPLPRLKSGSRRRILLLPDNQVLSKSISLPAATESNLREVLTFEMDQQTPFTADQVYFDFRVQSRSKDRRFLNVMLMVSPRRDIDRLTDQLAQLDLEPDAVASRLANGEIFKVPLSLQSRSGVPNRARHLRLAMAVAVALLGAAALALPLLQKRLVIADLESQLTAAMQEAGEGARLRNDIEQVAKSARDLVLKKQEEPSMLQLMNEITRITPDNTWLQEVRIGRNEVHLEGQSVEAAALISAIENSPILDEPSFSSPVTRVPRKDAERFQLTARWGTENGK